MAHFHGAYPGVHLHGNGESQVVAAPVLSAAYGSGLSGTTATVGCATDVASGTLYLYVSTSATPPASATLKAGTGAVWAGSVSVLNGAPSATATGLTPAADYYTHAVQTAASLDSNIASSAVWGADNTGTGGGTVTVDVETAPTISTQPVNASATEGGTVTFSVVATGTAPLIYQWRINGADIAGANAASYTRTASLADNGAAITVRVSNGAGFVVSSAATLTVSSSAVAPTIATQPAAASVFAGASVTFTGAANGTPAPTIQWQRNNGTGWVNIAGAIGGSYNLTTALADNGAQFRFVATNTAGAAQSDAALLTVAAALTAPTITTSPAAQTVLDGASVTLSSAATGNPTPTPQWRRNGVDIPGAVSSSYSITLNVADSGVQFDCVWTNSQGVATSAAATMTVTLNSPAVPSARVFVVRPSPALPEAWAGSTVLKPVHLVDPDATLDFAFEWAPYLEAGDALVDCTLLPVSAASITSVVWIGTRLSFWAAAVPEGAVVEVTCRIVTAAGRVDDRTLVLQGVQR